VTAVLIGSLKQVPIYESTATLLIERKSPQIISVQEVVPTGLNDYHAYKEYYETQYKLLKGHILLKRVAQILGLNNDNNGNSALKRLLDSITIKPIRNSQLVQICVQDPDPEMAAKIANTVAEEFIRQSLERNTKVASNAVEWLSKKIEEQRKKLINAELALARYRTKHNISILPQSKRENAHENIMAEYAELQALLANYSERYTDEHPKIIELKAQINSLRNKIEGLESGDQGNKSTEYRVLEREVQTNKNIYETLLTRLKELDLSKSLHVTNISIINRAEVPDKPIKPNLPLNMALAVMIGLLGGIGLAFFVDYFDTTIKSPADIKNILESHFLGSIPNIEVKSDTDKDKIVHIQPKSPISEAYKDIRTEILYLTSKDKNLAILITSAEPKAGKTMTCSNLAIALSQKGVMVLLVDADLRKPQIHNVFRTERKMGMSEYLTRKTNLESIVKDTEIENLKIITSGKVPHNPAELISSARMKEFISETKQIFDFIIFDSPPVASVTDAVILANIVDATIQVVRSGKAPVPIVLRAKEKLESTSSQVLGIILNDLKTYHGEYSYYKYYRYYGEDDRKGSKKIRVAGR
jgi:capsular exopolysaccharide synthesis family protein